MRNFVVSLAMPSVPVRTSCNPRQAHENHYSSGGIQSRTNFRLTAPTHECRRVRPARGEDWLCAVEMLVAVAIGVSRTSMKRIHTLSGYARLKWRLKVASSSRWTTHASVGVCQRHTRHPCYVSHEVRSDRPVKERMYHPAICAVHRPKSRQGQ